MSRRRTSARSTAVLILLLPAILVGVEGCGSETTASVGVEVTSPPRPTAPTTSTTSGPVSTAPSTLPPATVPPSAPPEAGCPPGALLEASRAYVRGEGGTPDFLEVAHVRCIGDWASGCAISAATGPTDCDTYYHLVRGSWIVASRQWDVCPAALMALGAPPSVAAALALDCHDESTG